MTRRYGMSNGWKIFWGTIITILIIGFVFCLIALICGSINNLSFVEQIESWFGVVKDVAPEVSDNIVSTNLFIN